MSRKKLISADMEGDKLAHEETPSESEVCCVCGETEDLKRCSRCKATTYCSKLCQRSHFLHHEQWCTTIESLKKLETAKIYRDRTVQQCQVDVKTQTKMLRLVGRKPMVRCCLDNKEFDMLWDTG